MSDNLPPGITLSPGGGCTIDLRPVFNRTSGAAEPRPAALPQPQPNPAVATPAGAAVAAPPTRLVASGTERGLNDGRLGVSGGNRAEMEERANRAIAAGQISPVRAAAMLAEEGFGAYAADTRSAPQAEHDREHGVGPTPPSPADYAHVRVPGAAELSPEEFQAADGAIRGALAGFHIPAPQAQHFIDAVDRAGDDMAACPTPEAREALQQKWFDQVEAVYGPGVLNDEAKWAPIKALADAIGKDNPLVAHMRANGLFFNPLVAAALLNRTAALATWKSSRPK